MSDDQQHQYLYAAITDTEGTIRATDAKASIALVLHGLIFAALLSVAKELGNAYHDGSCLYRVLVVSGLSVVGLTFCISVIQLVRTVRPAPPAAIPKVGQTSFFLLPKETNRLRATAQMESPAEVTARINELGDGALREDLIKELIKVSAIRERKSMLVRSGFLFLGVEICVGLGWLVVVGINAISSLQ